MHAHMHVQSSVSHNCQNLEVTKVVCSRWMDKKTVVHSDYGILFWAEKKLLNHKKIWKILECILLYKSYFEKESTVWFQLYNILEKA